MKITKKFVNYLDELGNEIRELDEILSSRLGEYRIIRVNQEGRYWKKEEDNTIFINVGIRSSIVIGKLLGFTNGWRYGAKTKREDVIGVNTKLLELGINFQFSVFD